MLTYGKLPITRRGEAQPVTAIAHLQVALDGITSDQTRRLQRDDDQLEGGGRADSLPVKLFILQAFALPDGSRFPPWTMAATADDLLKQVRTHPGGIALAPVELPDWRVKNLGVDNVYPAQQRGGNSQRRSRH